MVKSKSQADITIHTIGWAIIVLALFVNIMSIPFYVYYITTFLSDPVQLDSVGFCVIAAITVFTQMTTLIEGIRTAKNLGLFYKLIAPFLLGYLTFHPLSLTINTNPGFIYIMLREDGIYKIGRTDNTDRRLKEHEVDYGLEFTLVKRFVVPDAIRFEKLALSMTRQYNYREGNRSELRRMSAKELEDFMKRFTLYCLRAVMK